MIFVFARPSKLGFLALLLLAFVAPDARGERLPLRAYTTADGLSNNQINMIVRDSRGLLWFCTADGLSLFDGYDFTNFGTDQGLPHPVVNSLLETREGAYWIATDAGLVLFDPRGEPRKQAAQLNDTPGARPAMFSVVVPDDEDRRARAVNALLEDRRGVIWCGTRKGLYRLDRAAGRSVLRPVEIEMPSEYPEQGIVTAIVEDRFGSLWVGTPTGVYRLAPDGGARRYGRRDGLPDEFIHTLFTDLKGRLWVGTRNAGFFELDAGEAGGAPSVGRVYGVKSGLPTNWIYQLIETSDQRFWAATDSGVVEFFPDDEGQERRPVAYTTHDGLSYHEISALGEDAAGNLWLGTDSFGADRLARNGFKTFDSQDGVVAVNAIFEDRAGGLCFRGSVLKDGRAADAGGRAKPAQPLSGSEEFQNRLGRFDGQRFTWFKPDAINELGWVFEHVTLQARNGEWWVGTTSGLYHFPRADTFEAVKSSRPLDVYTTKNGLAAPTVYRLFEDSRGDVWVSTISSPGNGLALWDAQSGTLRDLAGAPGLLTTKGSLVCAFDEDRQGDVWMAFSEGVARYREGEFKLFGAGDGLPPGAVTEIFADREGRLWLASPRSGAIRVDDPSAERPAFNVYTTAQQLSSDNAQVITEDDAGHIYVGGGRGLDRLDPAKGEVKHFTTADGLAGGAFLSAFRAHDGELWFGTTRGLSRFRPADDEGTASPPPILIRGLQVAGARQQLSALGESEIALPDLSAGQNQLEFSFVGLNFASGDVLRYQYKLEGTDGDWSAPTDQRVVTYANLAPADYKFLVRALDSNGAVSPRPATVTFRVLPPLWRRWWFLTFLVLAAAALSYRAYRYRMDYLLEVERVRTRIATDLHDDIGSNLSKISILSEVAKHEYETGSDGPLGAIASISRESVAAMSDIVWAINPRKDSLLDLTSRMRRYAEDTLESRNIVPDFRAPDAGQDLRLGADARRAVYLIFKECLNNIVRHSHAKHATIELSVGAKELILVISDDGCGFDPAKDYDGNGMPGMRKRAEDFGSDLKVESASGAGTKITLRVPLIARKVSTRVNS